MIDIELYGGKRGLLEHVRARALFALGAYGDICDIEWAAVARLVFVCKGNICRSPYASARACALGIRAASFGLAAADGALADPAASRNASRRGVDLAEHRSARLESSSFAADDLVVVFEPGHLSEVRRLSGGRTPTSLLGVWAQPIHPHIQDPYGRSDRYFQSCFSLIDANVAALADRIARGGAPVAARNTSGNSAGSVAHSDRTPA
jgi:protein-tyrosine phosphatase